MSKKVNKRLIRASLVAVAILTASMTAEVPMAKASYIGTRKITVSESEGNIEKDLIPSNMRLYGRLTYDYNLSGGITITGCAEDTTWLKLTGSIDGKPIIEIDDEAFKGCKNLKSVIIGDSVTKIGKNAFSGTAIEYITIGASVKSVDDEAFADCKNLKHVYVYSTMDAEPFIGKDLFKNCNKDFTLYCGLISGWSVYARDNEINTVRNRKYCVDWEEPDHIYVKTTKDDWLNRVKRIKQEPEDHPEIEFAITEDEDGYLFERSGIYITKKDYCVLCNCTAYEYGANWVPIWEMALVPEVIFNIKARTGDPTIYDTVKPYPRFEDSDRYVELEEFSYKVNDRVIYAVNLYLAYPEYFNEGYYQFRGDGTWNYFWGDN